MRHTSPIVLAAAFALSLWAAPAVTQDLPEDLEYNRAQYEPVVRALWTAQKAFDEFVAAGLQAGCGAAGEFAVSGHGWRYGLWPLDPQWPKASDSADLDVEILGRSVAQQAGRYRYDFSQVRTDFDREAVGAALQAACAEYVRIGETFVREARGGMANGLLPGGQELQQAANEQAEAVRKKLESTLQQHAPAANGALFMALLAGERID